MALPRAIPAIQQAFSQRTSMLGPFLSEGAVYVVACDSADQTLIEVHKSTDPDLVAFAEQDGVNRPVLATIAYPLWVVQDGSDLHILHGEFPGRLGYSLFHMATDLWDATIVDEFVTTSLNSFSKIGGVAVRGDGDVIVAYQGLTDSFHGPKQRVDYARREGGVWTVDIALDNGGAINWQPGTAVLGASDRVHFFFSDSSNDDAFQRTLNSANMLEAFPAAFDSTVSGASMPVGQVGARYDDGGTLRVRVPYRDSGSTISVAKLDSTSDAPGVSVDAGVGDFISGLSFSQTTGVLAVDGKTLHLLYTIVDDDILHDENSDDAGWGVDDVELVGTVTQVYSNVYVSVATVNLGDPVLAYFYDDGGTLKYNERNLSLAPSASANVGGTIISDTTESNIVAGGKTLVITLTNDTWDPTIGADNAATTALIDGLDSDGIEAAGWDAEVKAKLTFNDVVRTSDTIVTITLPALAGYDITAAETITVTVPAIAVAGTNSIVATPTFDVVPVNADVGSSITPSSTEDEVVAGGKMLTITLTNDTWVAAGAAFDAERQGIIDGIDSAQAEAAGWDAVVKAGLAVTDVVRTSDTVVTVTFPAFPSYDITADETITVTVPGTAVTGGSPIVATPTFDITASIAAPAEASLGFLTRSRFFRFSSNSSGPAAFRTRNRRRRQDPD